MIFSLLFLLLVNPKHVIMSSKKWLSSPVARKLIFKLVARRCESGTTRLGCQKKKGSVSQLVLWDNLYKLGLPKL
jgi:hypothetical protein